MEAIILIGIQATGKTTFYQERFSRTHQLISLDVLKTRSREDKALADCIRARQPFVVDNTNVLVREREKYIRLAKEAGYRVTGYYFQSHLQDALRRNQQRSGKAVIPRAGVAAKFYALQHLRLEEGFDRLYFVSTNEQGGFIVQEWRETGTA